MHQAGELISHQLHPGDHLLEHWAWSFQFYTWESCSGEPVVFWNLLWRKQLIFWWYHQWLADPTHLQRVTSNKESKMWITYWAELVSCINLFSLPSIPTLWESFGNKTNTTKPILVACFGKTVHQKTLKSVSPLTGQAKDIYWSTNIFPRVHWVHIQFVQLAPNSFYQSKIKQLFKYSVDI